MAVVFILDVAVAAGAIGRETPCQVLGERAGNRALGLEITVLAQGGFDAALGSKLGARVLILITPAVVFLPNNVPWGPRKTSSCSMSIRSNTAMPGRPR